VTDEIKCGGEVKVLSVQSPSGIEEFKAKGVGLSNAA